MSACVNAGVNGAGAAAAGDNHRACGSEDPPTCAGGHGGTGAKQQGAETRSAGLEGLFKDKDFPVGEATLADDVPEGVVWKRPHELCEEPRVFVAGASRMDALQGDSLGDCWLIAACSALAEHPDLVSKLIRDDTELKPGGSKNDYNGVVKIRLWAGGSRISISIDDRLPVMNTDEGVKLMYGRCQDTSEFWLPLVEKAVAKYQGGYRKLCGRQVAEGLTILTGYSVHKIDLINDRYDLYDLLKTELERKSLIVAAGPAPKEKVRISRAVLQKSVSTEDSAKKSKMHSYTVNKVMELSDGTKLMRIRNPWGTEVDSTTKFYISKDVLQNLEPSVKEELMRSPCRDGEYWMDTIGFYERILEICIANKYPSVSKKKFVKSTEPKYARGKWEGKTIGGVRGSDTFENNPQFLFQVDNNKDKEVVKRKVPVLVELIQDLHRASPLPHEAGLVIYMLAGEEAQRQRPGAAGLRRYSRPALSQGADVQSPRAGSGSGKLCVVRHFYKLRAGVPHVALAWADVPAADAVPFVLRVYTKEGGDVCISGLPDPN